MSSNVPEARQSLLRARLQRGLPLEVQALASEFGVSIDTVRRDLKLLQSQGVARCVRGGAMPVSRPGPDALTRVATSGARNEALAAAALPLIEDGMVLMMDGGATVLALAQVMPALPDCLVVTPAPAVALACLAAGVKTQLIGGRLSPSGAITVGHAAVRELEDIAADLVFLGVCGIDPGFGFSADDRDEADVKRAMISASHRAVAVTGAAKLNRRARHRVCPCEELDLMITDAATRTTAGFSEAGLEVRNV
ncbi:DeoR/GlpR family DNA-binding transcription regulator [Antarctobacter jejuensis]|uniref:DeoR/GlpR family DNA-binding transcription regulator n=1 Tax=Antarctobacter jejuensis TaxID=1439938 RepID=UPI003FD3E234